MIHYQNMLDRMTQFYCSFRFSPAINILKSKPPGTYIVRDSNSFPGAFGLAVKVATPPPNVKTGSGDPANELVRHFLIEPTARGVRLKGCSNEPVFGKYTS